MKVKQQTDCIIVTNKPNTAVIRLVLLKQVENAIITSNFDEVT